MLLIVCKITAMLISPNLLYNFNAAKTRYSRKYVATIPLMISQCLKLVLLLRTEEINYTPSLVLIEKFARR